MNTLNERVKFLVRLRESARRNQLWESFHYLGGVLAGIEIARKRELLWYALVFALGALGEWWASAISGAWGWW